MGARNSSLATIDPRCEWCGALTVDAKQRGDFTICSRCSGVVGRKRGSRRTGSSSFTSIRLPGGEEEKGEASLSSPSALPQPGLSLVHVLPFAETLPHSDTAYTEGQLLSQFVTPYFTSRMGLYITAGQRYQIHEVDFKITACFPPAGQLTSSTVIRCMCPPPLHALTELKRLHVLPTVASLPPGGPIPSQVLFHEYLKPYFIPSSSSSSSSSAPPQLHLSVGDTFISKGLQFKVIACVPSDGVVTTSCDIFVEGEPLRDVQKVAILPIYESLPNNEKQITAEQILEKYLHPFFSGRFQTIGKNDTLDIDGVTFKVTACDPDRGLVTMATQIYSEGEPLRADDLRRQQEVEDEELARRMQQQEARDQGYPSVPLSFPVVPPFVQRRPFPAVFPPSLAQSDELRLRLTELLRQMPEQDGNRLNLRRMLETLPQFHGATQRDIDSLPTRVFVARSQQPSGDRPAHGTDEKAERKTDGGKEESREHLMCMVCLSDFEGGEVLRTLPCFHRYTTADTRHTLTTTALSHRSLPLRGLN